MVGHISRRAESLTQRRTTYSLTYCSYSRRGLTNNNRREEIKYIPSDKRLSVLHLPSSNSFYVPYDDVLVKSTNLTILFIIK